MIDYMTHLPEINSRILFLAKELGFISHNAFARSIDVKSQRMSNVATGRNKPDVDFCKQILLHHSDISGDWLLTGVGFMFKSVARKQDHTSPKLITKSTIVDNPVIEIDPKMEALQIIQDELNAMKMRLSDLVAKDQPVKRPA